MGLLFWNNHAEVKKAAYQSSVFTHAHILGMEGAALQAIAVALAVAENPNRPLDMLSFISCLLASATQDVYRAKITKLGTLLEQSNDRQKVVGNWDMALKRSIASLPPYLPSCLTLRTSPRL